MAETAKASTFIGSVLKQSGFSMDEVTEQTQRLVRAAADLSLTFGYDVQEALLAITACSVVSMTRLRSSVSP
jgi:hypothetical protein